MPRRPPAVARVLERVTATARAHEMFLPGETVLVAVSGGPDSTCLLHALHLLRRLFRIKLAAFHFDHRLRPDSAKDAAYVRRSAERLRLPFLLAEAEGPAEPGRSPEHAARNRRMPAMVRAMREADATRIAVAHTLDDQAETVLMAVLRGDGLDGVAGIRPVNPPFVQPLIDTTREDVLAFCRALHLRPRSDPTNLDTRLLRNAIRLQGLPALARATGREVRAPLARSARLLRRDADELARQAGQAVAQLVEYSADGFDLPATDLSSLPEAIASRVVVVATYAIGATPEEELVDAVLDLAAGRPGRRRHLPGGLLAERDRRYVRLSRTSPGGAGSGSRQAGASPDRRG